MIVDSLLRAQTSTPAARNEVSDAVHARRPSAFALAAAPSGELSSTLQSTLRPLALGLVRSNPESALTTPLSVLDAFFPPSREVSPPRNDWSVDRVELLADHPRYPYFRASATAPGRALELDFRSNGRAAFIDRSYESLQKRAQKKFNFAYLDASGQVRTADQAELLLQELDSTVTLSRVMSSEEAQLWESNQLDQLQSSFVKDGTHFALNHFRYRHQEPYHFEVPRDVLTSLLEDGKLVVNTYEDDHVGPRGIPAQGRSPFGLEMELVVLEDGRQRLQEYWQGDRPSPA